MALLASVIEPQLRARYLNPASMKQALVESAERLETENIFEQGQVSQVLP